MNDRTRALVVACVAVFLPVLVWYNYSAVLPTVSADWGLTGAQAGIVFGAFQAGYLVGILPFGRLADASSPRYVLAGGAAGTAVFGVAFGLLAEGFLAGTALRFLAGVCMSAVYVPGMRLLSDWFPAAERGRAIGIYVGTFSLSSGVSFVLTSRVAAAAGWETAVVATSLGGLLVAPLVVWLLDDAPGRSATSRGIDLSLLRNREYLHAVNAYAWHTWELFGVRNWLLAFLLAAPAFASGGASSSLAGLLVGVVTAMSAVGNVVGGALSDRIGRPTTVGIGLLGSTAILVALGWLDWLPLWALAAVLLVHGTLLSVDSAPASTLVTEAVDDEQVGAALSLQSFVGFLPSVASPVVFGAALDAGGFVLAWPTLAVAGPLGLASVVALRRRARRRSPASGSA
ncbi:MFS transporter [Haloparvum sedimenti]|uniref:MFS transporter n=1 Tax=Haloparvum sedimenti TaxID=1678448 RepID=UPI00071E7CA2|nr:MFS transporter [Haloparvum sedimenti]